MNLCTKFRVNAKTGFRWIFTSILKFSGISSTPDQLIHLGYAKRLNFIEWRSLRFIPLIRWRELSSHKACLISSGENSQPDMDFGAHANGHELGFYQWCFARDW
jgi:hypothetical protein